MKPFAVAVLYQVDAAQHDAVLAALGGSSSPAVVVQEETAATNSANPATTPADLDVSTLTPVQQQIATALLGRPMNDRQVGVLEIHLQNYRAAGAHLTIDAVAQQLVGQGLIKDQHRAADYVNGALRSFGKRLQGTLTKTPGRYGRDRFGDGVKDEVPLLAMFSIIKDGNGQARHRLTDDGAAAVAVALGSTQSGVAASSPMTEVDDPSEIVSLGMSRLSAALIERVAKTWGVNRDEAVRQLTALAGAG